MPAMNTPTVDLRSDTVTRPTAAMRDAMVTAPLGDDVFRDDPSVLGLERRVATLLGKEAALFVPSGTMANQLALRSQTRSGDEVIAHEACHILNYESGAAAALAGVTIRPVSSGDGTLPLDQVRGLIHQTDDPHFAPTTLICMENTHNGAGGRIVEEAHWRAVTELARERGIATHLDGARIMNAAVGSGQAASELAAPFDTVSLCLSKGLGAPVGSLLAGTVATIARAYRFRKMYGGGMRQAGVLAAAGLHALDHHVDRLADDHRRARALAEHFDALAGLSVDLASVQTNLVYFEIDPSHPLAAPDPGGAPALVGRLAEAGIWITGGGTRMRAVTHLDVDDAGLERALDATARLMGAG
jgi:threonine aldolase